MSSFMICFEFNFSGKKMFVNWWQSKTLQKYGQKCKFNYMYEVINDEMNKTKNCFIKLFNNFFFCKFLGGMHAVCEYSGAFCGKHELSSTFAIWIYTYWFRWLLKCEYW